MCQCIVECGLLTGTSSAEGISGDAGSGRAHRWQRGRTLTDHLGPYAASCRRHDPGAGLRSTTLLTGSATLESSCSPTLLASATPNGLPVKQSRNCRLLYATHVRQSPPAQWETRPTCGVTATVSICAARSRSAWSTARAARAVTCDREARTARRSISALRLS
jgi:hypothetical protein